jgi:hypothetical protein
MNFRAQTQSGRWFMVSTTQKTVSLASEAGVGPSQRIVSYDGALSGFSRIVLTELHKSAHTIVHRVLADFELT